MASLPKLDPFTTPAMEPPYGQLPRTVNLESMRGWLVATAVICLSISLLSIILRTFVKAVLVKKIEIEDYALIFSGTAFVAFVGLALGVPGQSRHLWNLTIAQAGHIAFFVNIVEILYGSVMFPAKLCVLLQMQRIFRGNKRDSIYWSIQVLIWSNLLFYLAVTAAFIGACSPRAKISNPLLPGTCISIHVTILATSAINIVSDITILVLPVFAVWKLKLPIKRKLIISAVFGSGIFACISSILRLVYSIRLTHTTDTTWAIDPVCMWAFAEFTTVIVAGAVPTLPRLIQFLSKRRSSVPSSYNYKNSRNSYQHGRGIKASDYMVSTHKDGSRAEMGVSAGAAVESVSLDEQPLMRLPQAARRVDRDGRVLKTVKVETSFEPSV